MVIVLLSFLAMAQDQKVAVFEPAGDAITSVKDIVRELISSTIVNTDGYTVLERQLINKVLEEHHLQIGGLVDDAQIIEMGKLMGANLAFVSTVSPLGDNFFVSGKLIDVQTARIEKQRTAQTLRGSSDLLSVVQTMGREMFGGEPLSTDGRQNTERVITGSEDYALLHIYRP